MTQLYHRDTSPGMGLRMVPKLKFEHISLTSFSKMRVDLAAQYVLHKCIVTLYKYTVTWLFIYVGSK